MENAGKQWRNNWKLIPCVTSIGLKLGCKYAFVSWEENMSVQGVIFKISNQVE